MAWKSSQTSWDTPSPSLRRRDQRGYERSTAPSTSQKNRRNRDWGAERAILRSPRAEPTERPLSVERDEGCFCLCPFVEPPGLKLARSSRASAHGCLMIASPPTRGESPRHRTVAAVAGRVGCIRPVHWPGGVANRSSNGVAKCALNWGFCAVMIPIPASAVTPPARPIVSLGLAPGETVLELAICAGSLNCLDEIYDL